MKHHLYLDPNVIAERFKFNTRDCHTSESVAEYVGVLRRLSEHCGYGDTLNDMLRGRIACGIKEVRIQQRLLSEKTFTLEKTLTIAYFIESAIKL